jgi:hypothetical protein
VMGQSRPAAETRPAAADAPVVAPAGDPAVWAPLFKYCPEKIESLMLVTAAGLPNEFKDFGLARGDFRGEDTSFKCVRAMQAARKFTQNWDAELVRVYELEKPISLADVLNEDHFSYESIGGVACFVAKPKTDGMDWGPVEDWVTVVERKYLIFATRRAILKEVLAGKGPSAETCVERLGWKPSDVRFGSPLVILRKYEQAKGQGAPVIDRLHFYWDAASKRGLADVVAKDGAAALKRFRQIIGDARAESRPEAEEQESWTMATADPVSSSGDRHVFSMIVKKSEYDWIYNQSISMIFGYQTPP